MVVRVRFIFLALAGLLIAAPALGEPMGCSDLANAIVETAAKDVLGDAVEADPDLQKLSGDALAKVTFVTDEMWDLLIDQCRLPS